MILVKKSLYTTFYFFVFTSIYIALVAVGMVHQTALLFNTNLSFPFYVFVFAGTLCSYNFHWYFTNVTDDSTIDAKAAWHIRYRHIHLAIALCSLLASGYFAFHLLQQWVWLALTALFVFLYSAPKVPLAPFNRLKKVAYGKTVFLALAWMHVTTMLPMLIQKLEWQMPHYLFALNRFFLIYAICILFDLRDQEQDQKEGIKSMITQMGKAQVSVIYYGILIFWAITTIWLAFYFTVGVVLALLLPGLMLLIGYKWLKRQQSHFVYYVLLDGLMVISYPLMLLFRF